MMKINIDIKSLIPRLKIDHNITNYKEIYSKTLLIQTIITGNKVWMNELRNLL